jgi:hypothetical protein
MGIQLTEITARNYHKIHNASSGILSGMCSKEPCLGIGTRLLLLLIVQYECHKFFFYLIKGLNLMGEFPQDIGVK